MAVFCNHDAPNGENYVKSCSKQCQVHKKKSREIAALNYVTFGKLLIIIPAFCVFMGMTFSFLDAPTQQIYRGSEKFKSLCQTVCVKTIFRTFLILHHVVFYKY